MSRTIRRKNITKAEATKYYIPSGRRTHRDGESIVPSHYKADRRRSERRTRKFRIQVGDYINTAQDAPKGDFRLYW